jgi:glycosyltransferase involved in cell wall biosynthesis
MKILHIISGDEKAGAAKGALNLHESLKAQGVTSVVYPTGRFLRIINKIVFFINYKFKLVYLRCFGGQDRFLSLNSNVINMPIFGLSKFDIVHLHWFNYSVDLKQIRRMAKKHTVVISMRDMWLLTGGCHYTLGCVQFDDGCRQCPLYQKTSKGEELRKEKEALLRDINIITISKWLSKAAVSTGVNYKTEFIYNLVDLSSFSELQSAKISSLKTQYGISTSKKIVLVGAIDLASDYKGGEFISRFIEQNKHNCYFLFFGHGASLFTEKMSGEMYMTFGFVESDVLNSLYNIADFFLMVSIQEAFGKTVVESLVTRTPVITLVGSAPQELIELFYHPGSIAWDGFSPVALPDYDKMKIPAEKYREAFAPELLAREHIEYYRRLAQEH